MSHNFSPSFSSTRNWYASFFAPNRGKVTYYNDKNTEAEGRQDEQGGLAAPNRQNRVADPRPDAVFTSPYPIFTRQDLDNKLEPEFHPRPFWKHKKIDKKLEQELAQAGISVAEYLALKNERLSLTLRDMHIYAQRRRQQQAPFMVRTPNGGIAEISGDKVVFMPSPRNFQVSAHLQEDLRFLMPYMSNFQLVRSVGPNFLQNLFNKVLGATNRLTDLDIAHHPQPNAHNDLLNQLNATPQNPKWQQLAQRFAPLQPEMAPEPQPMPQFHPTPRPY